MPSTRAEIKTGHSIETNPGGVSADEVLKRLHPDYQPQTEVIELPEIEPEPEPAPVDKPSRHYWWTDVVVVGFLAAAFTAVTYWFTGIATAVIAGLVDAAFAVLIVAFVIERIQGKK